METMIAALVSLVVASAIAAPSPLRVEGTRILDSKGKQIVLRGVNVAAMEWSSDGEGHILETVEVAIHDWKANHVRIPLSQDRWFGKAPEQKDEGKSYRALVRKIVDYCARERVYAMLDLHWNSGAVWGKNIGQHLMPDEHSILFWKDVASIYKNHPAVIFDLYNEPHNITWDVWRDGGQVTEKSVSYRAVGMKELLKTVRDTGAKNVVVVGGLDWSYDMSGFLNGYRLEDPKGNGIIYANHCYPFKGDTFEKWVGKMEAAIPNIPIIVSEFGSGPQGAPGLLGPEWVQKVVKYLQDKNLNWTAWDLHPAAGPTLISDWNYNPSPGFGVFVKEALTGEKVPASVIPVIDEGPTKAGQYDWMKRHQAAVDYIKNRPIDLLLIGDSITHGWGGPPTEGGFNVSGQAMWDKYFGSRNAVNLGFGWDSTQHVIWRLAKGEIDGIKPKAAMIMIGTNNIGWTSTPDIVTGITTIVKTLRRRLPDTKILLLGIFPRDERPDTKNRKQVEEINAELAKLKAKNLTYLDIGAVFKQKDGTLTRDINPDFLHLTPKGYELWAKAVDPTLAKLMGDKKRD